MCTKKNIIGLICYLIAAREQCNGVLCINCPINLTIFIKLASRTANVQSPTPIICMHVRSQPGYMINFWGQAFFS